MINYLLYGWYALVFLAFNSQFLQMYFFPKLLILLAGPLFMLPVLMTKHVYRLPAKAILYPLCTFIALMLVSLAGSPMPRTSFVSFCGWFSGITSFLFLLTLEKREKSNLLKILLSLAFVQILVLSLQRAGLTAFLPGTLGLSESRPIGTIGNEEFVATLLGVAFFIALDEGSRIRNSRWQIAFVGYLTLLLWGICLTGSKGTLFFIGLYLCFAFLPRKKPWLFIMFLGMTLTIGFLGVSLRSRFFLWLIGGQMFRAHPWFGVGLGQYGYHYLESISVLFNLYPTLRSQFGDLSGNILDGHNILLHLSAELGIAGFIFAISLCWFVWRKISWTYRHVSIPLAFALGLLLWKCFYTVVLTAPTSLLLLVTMLATVTPDRERIGMRIAKPAFITIAPVSLIILAILSYLSMSDIAYHQGYRLTFLRKFDEAEYVLRKSLTYNPENGDAYLGLAYTAFNQQDAVNMEKNIDRALFYQKTLNSYKMSARMEYLLGDYERAQQKYEYLHGIFPQHMTTMARLATIYFEKEDYLKAREMALKVLTTKVRVPTKTHDLNLLMAEGLLREIRALENGHSSQKENR